MKLKIIGLSLGILVLATIFFILSKKPDVPRDVQIDQAILLADDYIKVVTLTNGQFIYRIDLNPKKKLKPKYNLLRHMGTVYSLNMLNAYKPGSVSLKRLRSSVSYVLDNAVRPVEKDLLGVWSTKEISGKKNQIPQVKLGAAGLALVGMAELQSQLSEIIKLNDLEKLADFILFMQKEDGGFHSKYIEGKGKDKSWVSLYYPGEAAFGLVELYKVNKKEKYMESAIRAIEFLYNERKEMNLKDVPADHWALIASSKILEQAKDISTERKSKVLSHAEKVIQKIVNESEGSTSRGGFTKNGKTTPTATRLEGLIAFYPHIENQKLKSSVMAAIESGIDFLLKAQISKGHARGAWARSIHYNTYKNRNSEVRIDYVQHAMSALIGYQNLNSTK